MQSTIQYIQRELTGLYPESEVQAFIRLMFEYICGWSYTEQVLNRNKKILESQRLKFRETVSRLKKYEPIQYIFGETEFMRLKLKVNSFVLIPRPETEELVDLIIRSNSLISPHILDIGTGSGCIPIAIKHHVPDAKIYGVDISSKAIEVAELNSSINKLEAEFYERDILNWQKYKWGTYDIIVSNPPYVRELEKYVMDKNVLAYEPENALFVPNDDPLLFFRKITEFALKHLAYNGKLFFEINEYLGEEIHNLLLSSGFKNIKIKKDINGKNRMIYCQLLKMN